jgi:hypothetical protein
MPRRRWTCDQVDRVFLKISDSEMRQRLAEILELLLTPSSQLQKVPAFSKINSRETPRLNFKRRKPL